MTDKNYKLATFGAGCFWCVEAVFQRLKGVTKVQSGYSGGHKENPTYDQVCSETTGHAEVCQITFDPEQISFEELLKVFWKTHDPTTLNQQGADKGTQYRSAIFYHDHEQKEIAESMKAELVAAKVFDSPIVTEITKFDIFYEAEAYHDNYYDNNPAQPYCAFVITPKVKKLEAYFADKLK